MSGHRRAIRSPFALLRADEPVIRGPLTTLSDDKRTIPTPRVALSPDKRPMPAAGAPLSGDRRTIPAPRAALQADEGCHPAGPAPLSAGKGPIPSGGAALRADKRAGLSRPHRSEGAPGEGWRVMCLRLPGGRGFIARMLQVVPLRYGTVFKKAFSDSEVFSRFASDVLGVPVHVQTVHQEYRYPETVGRVNVEYDLFAEDVDNRIIVEVQHIRERDFFDRFLHYHAVGIIEQATSHIDYRPERTVFTIVVLTTEPRAEDLRFSMAVSDMDPVNEEGQHLGVYHHRLVFLNPKIITDRTPPAVRRWMELIADSLDRQVDEERYEDPLMKRVLGSIRDQALSPDELRLVLDEAAWEDTKRHERREGRLEGRLEGMREAVIMMARTLGLVAEEGDVARIEACEDLETLQRWLTAMPGAKRLADVLDAPPR